MVRYPAYIATNGGDNGTTTGGYYGGPGSGGMIHLQALRVTVTTTSSGGLQALGQQNVAGYNDFRALGASELTLISGTAATRTRWRWWDRSSRSRAPASATGSWNELRMELTG